MSAIIGAKLRCSEALALRWSRLATRMGYSVDAISEEYKRRFWELRAAAELKRMAMGWISNEKRIDTALVEKVIALDQSAFVVTGATAIHVRVNKDYFQLHDSTCSWWIDMRLMSQSDRVHLGYQSRVDYTKELSDLVIISLVRSFVASGAEEWAAGAPRESLFICETELTNQWPAKILPPEVRWELFPLYDAATSPPAEQFLCGKIRKTLGSATIQAGPAFDPKTWEGMGYLAIERKGLFWPKRLIDEISNRILHHGGKLIN